MSKSILIIGGGPGGYVAAIRAAQLGAKVTLVEKEARLGGTCLNVGCIPSKALLQYSHFAHVLQHEANHFGIEALLKEIHMDKMQEAKGKIVSTLTQGIAFLLKKNKIEHIQGEARFVGPKKICVKERILEADYIILATGSAPIALSFLPIDEQRVLSSTGALALKEVPEHLLVVGAGVIGLELGSMYHALGARVTFIEFLPRICPGFDPDVSETLQQIFTARGMEFHLNTKVMEGKSSLKSVEITVEGPQGRQTLQGDYLLQSIGRRPMTQGLAPEIGGVRIDEKGFIETNAALETSAPCVYAIGDVTYGPMLAHKASHEGIALVETLLGKPSQYNTAEVPNVIYTHPEVAQIGLGEEELKKRNIAYKVGRFPYKANARGLVEGDETGSVKVLLQQGTGHLLGATIICAHASELLPFFQLAIHLKIPVSQLRHIMIAHPTLGEAMVEAILNADKESIHF